MRRGYGRQETTEERYAKKKKGAKGRRFISADKIRKMTKGIFQDGKKRRKCR